MVYYYPGDKSKSWHAQNMQNNKNSKTAVDVTSRHSNLFDLLRGQHIKISLWGGAFFLPPGSPLLLTARPRATVSFFLLYL